MSGIIGATTFAGPDELGRNLIVRPGAVVPAPWTDAERIVLGDESVRTPHVLLPRLREAAAERQRLVFEVDADVQQRLRAPAIGPSEDVPLHDIGARYELVADELLHLVRSNSVVATDGADGPARWAWGERAERLGAARTTGGDVEVTGAGPVWIDGGPLRWSAPIDGIPVIPAVSVEHGTLAPFGTNRATAALAADQVEAVEHPTGSSRIVAPAGSGKTRVLTERARHLVRGWGLPASAVTLVAYNRRAQEEMQQRLADVPGVQVRTLNSIALAIVNGVAPFAPQLDRWRTLDEREVRGVLSDLVRTPRRRNVDPYAPWIDALTAVRLGMREPSAVERDGDGDVTGLAEVAEAYEERLRSMHALDFDAQVVTAIRLLLADPATRERARSVTRVLLVDEFQDLTPAHVLLLRLLASPTWNLFGVGDDDQTIYGYNGADPSWLIDFDSLVPAAGSHALEVNYRCPPDVVEQVDRLLRHNRRRVPKTIRAGRDAPGADGTGLRIVGTDDPVGATLAAVSEALADGRTADEIAVLTRVNVVLAPVQVALTEAGVPVRTAVGPEFLERTAVRSAIAWIRLATAADGSFNGADLAEAVRRPSRGLRPRIAEWVAEQRSLDDLRRLAGRLQDERDAGKVADLVDDLSRLRQAARIGTSVEVLDVLCEDIGLAGTLATFDGNRRGTNATSPADDLVALRHLAALGPAPIDLPAWLRDRLDRPRTAGASAAGVVLATVHRVKGQEWPEVVVHLATADQFPHRLAEDVEEERRIFHVALTRCQERVTVVTGRATGDRSPFIDELTTEPSERTISRAAIRSAGPPSRPAARATAQPTPSAHPELDAALRALRLELAEGKPAYTVFSDRTLGELVEHRPGTRAQLSRIHGIGASKLSRFGDAILEVIAAHPRDTGSR